MTVITDTEGREAEISALFTRTFAASEGAEEGRLIGTLARDLLATTAPGDLRVYASLGGAGLRACIMFSRLRYDTDRRTVFVLGPVAVHPDCQGQGIGTQLITHGLDDLRAEGVDVALTYGDPRYYVRTGFAPVSEALVAAPYPLSHPEGWLGQSLTDRPLDGLAGPVRCVPAFRDPAFW